MKKIINGFRYDTEKAEKVCSWQEGKGFSRVEATLYCTPRAGRFFLAGKGGPMTIFNQGLDSKCWSGESDLIPISPEAARMYAKQYARSDYFEKFFPEA